jgi:hypothetical protein
LVEVSTHHRRGSGSGWRLRYRISHYVLNLVTLENLNFLLRRLNVIALVLVVFEIFYVHVVLGYLVFFIDFVLFLILIVISCHRAAHDAQHSFVLPGLPVSSSG